MGWELSRTAEEYDGCDDSDAEADTTVHVGRKKTVMGHRRV